MQLGEVETVDHFIGNDLLLLAEVFDEEGSSNETQEASDSDDVSDPSSLEEVSDPDVFGFAQFAPERNERCEKNAQRKQARGLRRCERMKEGERKD